MLDRNSIKQQIPLTLSETDFPQLGEKYEGKVRDCYVKDGKRVLITSDRLSAFDRVLTTVPFKGALINGMAAYWFEETKHIIKNHVIAQPHPNVFVAEDVKILPVEIIVRGYLTGSAWRDYQAGKAISGITLPKWMKRWDRFHTPLVTPSTKAEKGEHDLPISSEDIVNQGLVPQKLWEQAYETALALFEHGTKKAAEHGLILVDTKYEFGTRHGSGELILADEIHTQDSSRYWMKDTYQARFSAEQEPDMLDKEFVRRWLMERGYMGEGTPPVIDDEFRIDIAVKYMEAFELITGRKFEAKVGKVVDEIAKALKN